MSPFLETVSTIALAIVGLAVVSVLVSKNAQTSSVIQATGSAFVNSLGIAEAPVTGASYQIQTAYPSNAGQDFTGSFGFG